MAGVTIYEEVKVQPLDNWADRFTADGTGRAEGRLRITIPGDQYLYLDRIVIRAPNSSTFTDFILYANDTDAVNTREYIDIGPTNVAAEPTPVVFAPNEQMIAVWRGLTADVTATLVLTGWFIRRIQRDIEAYDTVPAWSDRLGDRGSSEDDRLVDVAPAQGRSFGREPL